MTILTDKRANSVTVNNLMILNITHSIFNLDDTEVFIYILSVILKRVDSSTIIYILDSIQDDHKTSPSYSWNIAKSGVKHQTSIIRHSSETKYHSKHHLSWSISNWQNIIQQGVDICWKKTFSKIRWDESLKFSDFNILRLIIHRWRCKMSQYKLQAWT
jgi:hypothetical protein